jgi:deoxyribonuclease-4
MKKGTDGPLVGAHMSIAGGVHTALERGAKIGCRTIQLFTKNSNQWDARQLSEEEISRFRELASSTRIAPLIAHSAYLINLAARNAPLLERSRSAFLNELLRCEALGVAALVLHPGSHGGAGEEDGMKRIAESLNLVHEKTGPLHVRTALETTAGQGTSIGYLFEQIRGIINGVEQPDRIAVCIDTAHVFAAGYEIVSRQGFLRTMKEFDDILGLERLAVIHVNDSKKPFASRVDRHEHIGKGLIGLEAFRLIMNDERLRDVPKILETPKGEDMREDVRNFAVLRSLVRRR